MRSLLSQTFLWTKKWSRSRYGLLAVFVFLFLDASVFPLPTTVLFITVSLIHPTRSYYNALVAVTGMALGSIVGYFIGHFLWLLPDGSFTQMAHYIFNHIPGFSELNYQHAQGLFIKWSYGILLFSTIIPIPYQILTITAGAFEIDIFAFVLATIVFQGLRFFSLAWLIIKYGEGVTAVFKKNIKIIAVITITLLLLIYIISLIGS